MGRPESVKVVFQSVLLNMAVTAVKGALAYATGSAALLADTIHGASDVVESVAVLIGVHISMHKSPQFPLGLYKTENVAALLSSLVIIFSAYEITRENILLSETLPLTNIGISVPALILVSFTIYMFMRYERGKGLELNSPAIKADAQHWRTDIFSTLVVLAGVLGAHMGLPAIDKAAALVVTVIILKAGWNILSGSMKSLLDASVEHETLDRIRGIVRGFPEVAGIKSIVARNSGRFIFCNIDLSLSVRSLKRAHEISDAIESSIKKEIPPMDRVVIHYEPVPSESMIYAVPLADRQGDVSRHFGTAPYIALLKKEKDSGALMEKDVVENPFASLEKGKGIQLARYLVNKGVDVVFSGEPLKGKGPAYVFEQAEVDLRFTGKEKLADIIAELPN